ncbi:MULTISPECIES: carbohydrate kinase family protein [Corynebacterium]|uniref:carbohydrate kinase family protein n=1 Tax=Corynebacterium TaxID=1716 RepID=UPI00254AAF91|nr:carbohydrate kinase [Corynebacterium accolens]MDK8504307.1 carbohydrate kinase [Corynebacterium accolens]MDK8660566.1 carbohydrate kinase [Corynebacterium accolens]
MTIHVCGEGLVDLVPVSPGRLNDLTPALGGGPFNVAIAAARLGADVEFQSRISTDGFGQELFRRLEEEGVVTAHVQRGEEPTTLAVTSIADNGTASYNFYVEGTADRFVEPKLVPADIACFGTVSLALEPGASRYAQLLKDFAAQGTLVALDPNIRPFYATAAHKKFLADLLPHVSVLKLSDEEVDFLGEDFTSQVPIVVTTRGGDGISVRAGDTSLDVPAAAVEVTDTIGAGDTIMAALLAQLDERDLDADKAAALSAEQWRDILHFAATAAGITVSRTGANPPLRKEVESAL